MAHHGCMRCATLVTIMLVAVVGLHACETEVPGPPAAAPDPGPAAPASLGPADEVALVPKPVVAEVRVPIGYRVAKPATVVHVQPHRRRGRRGRIEGGHPFAIHGFHAGPDCAGEGWAAVDQGGFACLEHAVVSPGPASVQPRLHAGQDVPYIYARPKVLDRRTEAIARVPRYRDRLAHARGEPPMDTLGPDRQYTFVQTKLRAGGLILIDADDHAVPARDMKIARPSRFAGRDLARAPVPAGLHAAWSVSHPAVLRERADVDAKPVHYIRYHATLNLDPAPITVGEATWYAVPDGGGPGVAAYVASADVNHWIPGAAPQVGADEIWLDVELGQQTLAVMRGPAAIFVTLVSSGAGGFATPTGLFRIYEKLAVSTMKSSPSSEDPYFVEGVPWIQYFHRRYAFHASYWHDDFGKRRSHGCVNLAPKDAAYVFGLTRPGVPPGWNALYEHAGAAGTLVRVRRGTDAVPDLRLPLGVIESEEEPGDKAGDSESGPPPLNTVAGP